MKSIVIGMLGLAALVNVEAGLAAEPADLYKSNCALCHDSGVAGAPKLGDKEDWAPRISQGKEALYKVGMEGKPGTAMIAKGGQARLTEADIKAIVDFMVDRASK